MKIQSPFADRRAAGRALAQVLAKKKLFAPVVLALPRGGDPEVVTNDDVIHLTGVSPTDLAAGVKHELKEIERRRSA